MAIRHSCARALAPAVWPAILAVVAAGAQAATPGLQLVPEATEFLTLSASRARLADTGGPGLRISAAFDSGIGTPRAHTAPLAGLLPRAALSSGLDYASGRGSAALDLRRSESAQGAVPGAPRSGLAATTLTLSGDYAISPRWGLTASMGSTLAETSPSISESSQPWLAMRTDFVSVGVLRRENWLPGDRIALSLGQPRHRALSVGGPVFDAGDLSGTGTLDRLSLRPGNRELLAEIQYFAPVTRHSGLGLSLANRARLVTEPGANDERIMSIRFSTQF